MDCDWGKGVENLYMYVRYLMFKSLTMYITIGQYHLYTTDLHKVQ